MMLPLLVGGHAWGGGWVVLGCIFGQCSALLFWLALRLVVGLRCDRARGMPSVHRTATMPSPEPGVRGSPPSPPPPLQVLLPQAPRPVTSSPAPGHGRK